MSEEVSWKKIEGVYTAHLLIETSEGFRHLSEDEDIAYIMYYAEKKRRKPRLFRRAGEKVECVARLYYPFIVKKLRDNQVVIFDPKKGKGLTLKYNLIEKDKLDDLVEELTGFREKEFLDRMINLERKFKDIVEGRELVKPKTVTINNIVVNRTILNNFKIVFNRSINYVFPGVKLTINEIPVEQYISELNTVIDEIAEIIGYLNSLVTKLNKYVSDWKADVSAAYGERIRELDARLEVVKKEVFSRIEELKTRREEEIKEIRDRENPVIRDIENRIKELETKLEELKLEYQRSKEYGEDTKELRRKISELEKQIREQKDRKQELVNKMEQEIKDIEKRYNEMIESERQRVKTIEYEKKRLDEELESIIKQGEEKFNSIRDLIYRYIETLKLEQKKIIDATIPMPTNGEGVYWLTLYVIIYSQRGEPVRTIIIPPAYIRSPGKIVKHARVDVFEGFEEYFGDLIKEAKEKYREWIEELNLMKKIPVERIEMGLRMLVDKNIVSKKNINTIIESLREQI